MEALFPAAACSARPDVRPSPWLSDILAGVGLVVFLGATFVLAASL
jgi:hypothetical protein